MSRERFPRRVFREGTEPDPRFSLANERTFLAWLRTALAMFAAALALEALELPTSTGWRLAAGTVFLILGLVCAVQAWWGWMTIESALRREAPLPGLPMGGMLVGGVVLAIVLVAIGLFV